LFLDSKITFVVFGGKEDLGFIRKAIGKEGSDKAIKFIDMQTKTAAEKDNKEVQKVNSLKRCTEELYGKKFSKFEQCSAWNIRPLRKAQLHYAALDARVLLDIYDHRSPGPGQDEMREC
jgi:ribonuclease D